MESIYLRSHNPDQADPPELNGRKHCAQHVAQRAGNKVSQDVLDGVALRWKIIQYFEYKSFVIRLTQHFVKKAHDNI